MTHNFNLMN